MATITKCRCGKPLLIIGSGQAVYCEHCDRATCKGLIGGCPECATFDKATKDHAAKTNP